MENTQSQPENKPEVIQASGKKLTIKLGEIFEYEIANEGEIDKIQAFFIRVGQNYYLINIDSDDKSFCFFDKIAGMTYKGQDREGKSPFNYKECLEYLRMKKVKNTGKMVIEPPKEIKTKKGSIIYGEMKAVKNSYFSNYSANTYDTWDTMTTIVSDSIS